METIQLIRMLFDSMDSEYIQNNDDKIIDLLEQAATSLENLTVENKQLRTDLIMQTALAQNKQNVTEVNKQLTIKFDALLKDFKVKIETFTSGSSILKAYELGRKYDIIFMDHMMPELDGIETTKRIRSLPGDIGKNVISIDMDDRKKKQQFFLTLLYMYLRKYLIPE